MASTIKVEGLTKAFGSFKAVDEVSFEAVDGKVTALLGPSGSGKSTVLRMIAGLERPNAGRVTLSGEEVTASSVQERRVGFVFQHYALFRHMTVRQNVEFGLAVRKEAKAGRSERVDQLLDLVQLTPFAGRYPHHLSGGQRQRVALARALAPRPKVLLLDEPFGALDARVRQDLRHWLDELHRQIGVTSLLVTHDQEEALELADRVVVMHEGRVEQVGTPEEVYNQPATPFVAGFVGSANVLRGQVEAGRVVFGGEAVWDVDHIGDGSSAHAFVRPHDVVLAPLPIEGVTVPATLERINNLGWMSKLHLRLPDGQTVIAHTPNDQLDREARAGTTVFLELRNAKLFDATHGEDSDPAGRDVVAANGVGAE